MEIEPGNPNASQYSLKRGFKSGIILPVRQFGKIVSSIHLLSDQANIFDDQELRLLEKIANDLSFALDIFEKDKLRRESEEKTRQAKRLYAFISAINQTIVHAPDTKTLFEETCRIAIDLGKFEFAFIGNIDHNNKLLHLVAHKNGIDADMDMFLNFNYQENGALDRVLKSGHYSYINDYEKAPAYHRPTQYALGRGFRSGIIMPLWQSGRIVATLNLLSGQANTFDDQELKLLEGITNDLSFALDTYEKERLRREAEVKKNQAMRLYAFISAINQTIVHISDKQELFNKTCRIAVEIGDFELALVCIADEDNRTISIIAHANASPAEVEMFQNLTFEDTGATAFVLKSGKCSYINDFENGPKENNVVKYALRRGFRSGIVLPLKQSGKINATLNLMSGYADMFNEQEVRLLEEITDDISFALDVIEQETQRKKAEIKLKHNESRLKQAQAIAHIGSWEEDFSTGIERWSEETCRIYGLPPEQNKQTFESWLSFIHPEDRDYILMIVEKSKINLTDATFYHRIITRDGTVKYIYSQSHFEFNSEGIPTGKYGVAHDVTEQKEAEEKIIHANRLYAFISQINQIIVRSTDQQTVFKEACRIAIEYGKFKAAWIGLTDKSGRKLNLIEECGMTAEDIALFTNIDITPGGVQDMVISSGKCFVGNDINKDPILVKWHPVIKMRKWRSCMTLPIMKSDKVVGTFNILSDELNFFDSIEINLLMEATSDISFALDIFEKDKLRQEFEKNLLHSELRFKQAQSIAHIGSWELNFKTGLGIWTDETCKIFGLLTDNNIHTHEDWEEFIHPDDLEYVRKIYSEELKSQGHTAFHHRIIRKNGEIRYVYSQASLDYNGEGYPTGLIGAVHDITETRMAEEALAQSEANLRLIMDLIPQSVFAKDASGKFLFVNKSFASLYGLNPEQLIARNIHELISVIAEEPGFIQSDKEVISTGKPIFIPEHSFTDHNGNIRIFNTIKSPIKIAGPDVIAALGVSNEITQQKQIEAERSKMIADIIQRNKDLEQFSYIVSHNLRAPVANIMGITEVLQYPELEKDDKLKFTQDLDICVNKLDEVIRDLNFVLQLKAKQGYKYEILRFSKILEDIKKSIATTIRNEHVTILHDFDQIDEYNSLKSYIHSIFYNLISNSLKYKQPGLNPVIEIKTVLHNNTFNIIFKDNGMGIDLKKRGEQVFGLYKRFHTHVEGKGMGLFMVKTQVESLGGRITIESEVNKGTTFNIELEIGKIN